MGWFVLKNKSIFLCVKWDLYNKQFGDITSRRCFTIKQELPINEQIKAREVQVIDENGQKIGKLFVSHVFHSNKIL